jgi:dihydroorotase
MVLDLPRNRLVAFSGGDANAFLGPFFTDVVAFDLSTRHRHRFHVLHVSTGVETDLIREAIATGRGLITGEACPHHLFFSVDDYPRLGTLVQMNPSLKTRDDSQRLWRALGDGALQVVATDHAPHTLEEKARPYPASPAGVPAVENSLALMLDAAHRGLCTPEQVAHWMCDAPARVWDLVGKGRIAVGYDADLVLVDPNARRTVRNVNQLTKCGWSPWDGVELAGWPVRTLVGGQTVYRDGRVDDTVRGTEAQFDHARGGYWATP